MAEPVSLKDAAWLKTTDLQTVFDALMADGGEARIAGGAVRDGLLGLPVNDIDIAATEPPDRVIALAQAAGLKVHPTGMAHGTVTVVSGTSAFEVTTLRVDVETFGRHAAVAYTTDWEADAQRRDFTLNALFCDRSGNIWDFAGGLEDLADRRVRFVGNPAERIEEDHLRILRFFRFFARYGGGPPDPEALSACAAEKSKLAALSRERVRQEFFKLILAPRAVEVLGIMKDSGLLELIFPGEPDLEVFGRCVNTSRINALSPDAVLRLALLYLDAAPDDLRRALVLSNQETGRLQNLAAMPQITPAFRDAERQTLLYWHGPQAVIDALMRSWCGNGSGPDDADWRNFLKMAQAWEKPHFPVSGQDLLAAGIEQGVELGRCLQALEDWWVAGGFIANRDALMARLGAIQR